MFPSSLGPIALRWFNRLEHASIHSWDKMAEAFVSRFITNSRTPRELDSFLSMSMKDSKSLKNYNPRFWELYNEVDGCSEEIAVKTFKLGLASSSKLRQALTKRLAKNMQDLMSRIEQYVRVEEDRLRTETQPGQAQPPRRPSHVEPRKNEAAVKDQLHFP